MAADVATSLASWSTTESSNLPIGSTAISTNLDDNLRMIQSVVRYLAAADTIASSTTTDLGTKESKYLTVSGTTTITGLGTISAGIPKYVIFSGVLTLTHNATSLILPGAANITTAAGDVAKFVSLGSGNWRCLGYSRASGLPIVSVASIVDGTVGAPGLYFTNDTDCGMYRIGANNWALSAGGTKVVDMNATTVTVPVALSVTGNTALTAGLTVAAAAFNMLSTGFVNWTMGGTGGTASIASGSNNFEVSGHSTGGGRLSMLSTGVALYSGVNIPLYLSLVGGTATLNLHDAHRISNATKHLTVIEAAGKPTITSGSGTPAGTISGTDQAFKVTLGTTPGTTLVIAFNGTWANAPMVFPRYQSADINVRASGISTTSVTFTFASAPATNGILDVFCIGYQAT